MTKLQELLSTKSPRWLLSIFWLSASLWPYAWPLGRAMEGHQKPSFCLWGLDEVSRVIRRPYITMRVRVLLHTRFLYFVIASTSFQKRSASVESEQRGPTCLSVWSHQTHRQECHGGGCYHHFVEWPHPASNHWEVGIGDDGMPLA